MKIIDISTLVLLSHALKKSAWKDTDPNKKITFSLSTKKKKEEKKYLYLFKALSIIKMFNLNKLL